MTTPIDDFDAPGARPVAGGWQLLREKFAAVLRAGGGEVVVPPGCYLVDDESPITLGSDLRVLAHGAHFVLPATLEEGERRVCFAGSNVQRFSWAGGSFEGHCFDPVRTDNSWEPNASTRVFVLTTTAEGSTGDITFRDLRSRGVAGAVVSVFGVVSDVIEAPVENFATDIVIENCSLLESGKFMWDYGYLWQRLVWPHEFDVAERALAERYFPAQLLRGGLTLRDGSDVVECDAGGPAPAVSSAAKPGQALCFLGSSLPRNLVRGKAYYVCDSRPGAFAVAESVGGPALRWQGDGSTDCAAICDLYRSYMALYEPAGSGPGKGAFDLVGCRNVRVSGCRLSARGDTMHIQRSHNIVFSGNQILGSRMGAFFLAEYCKNAVVNGNTIDGTNGSRVMSVEKSCEDVTITGNTFKHGGRGSWINQPRNIVIEGNIFVHNTTKSEQHPQRGRRSYDTGNYEEAAELYFTRYRPDGAYGPVVVRGNIFRTGPAGGPALTFAPGGSGIVVCGNILEGSQRAIVVDPNCRDVVVADNLGAQ